MIVNLYHFICVTYIYHTHILLPSKIVNERLDMKIPNDSLHIFDLASSVLKVMKSTKVHFDILF